MGSSHRPAGERQSGQYGWWMAMTPPAAELSPIESVGVFVMFWAILYAYYHYPRVPAGGRGIALSGSVHETVPRACGPGCVVCPRCDAENEGGYRYCSNCVGRLWGR